MISRSRTGIREVGKNMILFGKSISEYLRFQKPMLLLVAAVGMARLALSLAGSDAFARRFSMTALLVVAIVMYPVLVHLRNFGGYKQILVLLSVQLALAGAISALGIGVGVLTGTANIFSGQVGNWATEVGHALQHLLGGPILIALILWIPASVVLFVTRRVAQPRR